MYTRAVYTRACTLAHTLAPIDMTTALHFPGIDSCSDTESGVGGSDDTH